MSSNADSASISASFGKSMKLDQYGNAIIGSIENFIEWFGIISEITKTLKNGERVDLNTAHLFHLLEAMRVFEIRHKKIPMDKTIVTEIREFLYRKMGPWVRQSMVSELITEDGNCRIYSCKCSYPGSTEFNTWEEYLHSEEYLSKKKFVDPVKKEPHLTEEERAENERRLLQEPTNNSPSKPEILTKAQLDAKRTREANAILAKKKKDKAKIEQNAEVAAALKREAKIAKQIKIAKAKRHNALKCAEKFLEEKARAAAIPSAKVGGSAIPSAKVGGGGGYSEESKEYSDDE